MLLSDHWMAIQDSSHRFRLKLEGV